MINNLKYGTYEVVEAKDTFVLYDNQFVNKLDADKYFYKLVQDKIENKDNLYNRVYLLEWANDFKSWSCTKDWIYGKGYKVNDIRVKSKFKIIKQLFIKRIVLRRNKKRMTDNFEERLKQFRKDLEYICRQHYIILDAGHNEYLDGTTDNFIICRDGKHRSDWKRLREEN